VVAMETASGTEPCAVLACRGDGNRAAKAVEHANARMPEFQRLRRWALWPEPDLPRTSTGKVRRKEVAEWLAGIQAAATNSSAAFSAGSPTRIKDWLQTLISEITGEPITAIGDELRLTEDLHLDSLGRVQLAAALEERLGITAESGLLDEAETLGDVRALAVGEREITPDNGVPQMAGSAQARPVAGPAPEPEHTPGRYIYPLWPWLLPFRWVRTAFVEAVMRPLVWLLAKPTVVAPRLPAGHAPMLIIANHVTAYDGPLIQYALPGHIRRRIAVAMSGEMLEDYRHFRNPERAPGKSGFYLPGPPIYLLLTTLFNVFPLPRRRDFQASFSHAGKAMDRGFNVLAFPEGTRSAEGQLASFRGGIGLLTKQSGATVLPVAIRGLGELKTGRQGWFRSGTIEVRVGQPIQFSPEETETAITARLHAAVEKLLKG
jgi:long-chain acyl-CoA synthetase